MHITRRSVLTLLAAGLVSAPQLARAQSAGGTLYTVSDGHLVLPARLSFDQLPEPQRAALIDDFSLHPQQVEPECNLTLLQRGTDVILFDVGAGPDFMPSAGRIASSLEALGLTPSDVTHVIFTHAHPDHIWGVLDDFDDLLFPNAAYLMGKAEWDYWWDPSTVDSIGAERAAFAVGAKRRMAEIEDKTQLFAPGAEVLPGIVAVAAQGHTPGHSAFNIGGDTMVLGDAIANHHVALRHPAWTGGSDQEPDRAAAARARLLEQVTAEQMRVVGFHLPQGGMGRIDRDAQGFVFVPDAS